MAPTTPTGSLITRELPISSCQLYDAARAALSANSPMGSPTWNVSVRLRGIPTSWLITSAISPARAWSPSAIFCRYAPRSLADVAAQPGKARLAAWTARSISAGVPAGIVANTSSVVESITSNVSDPDGETQAPSMYRESRRIMTAPRWLSAAQSGPGMTVVPTALRSHGCPRSSSDTDDLGLYVCLPAASWWEPESTA